MTYTSCLNFYQPVDPEQVMGMARQLVGIPADQPIEVERPDYYANTIMLHSIPGGYQSAIRLYIANGSYQCDCTERFGGCDTEFPCDLGWDARLTLDISGDWAWGIENHRRILQQIAERAGGDTKYYSDFDKPEHWPAVIKDN